MNIFACKTAKKTQQSEGQSFKDASLLLKKQSTKQIQATWLVATGNISAANEGSSEVTGTCHLRMEKDRAIWLSLRKFGIEGMRVLITPDSFYYVNRLERKYLKQSFSHFKQKYQLPSDFAGLQQILLGNPVFLDIAPLKMSHDTAHYFLKAHDASTAASYVFEKNNLHLKQMLFQRASQQQEISFSYEKFEKTSDNQEISYFRSIKLTSKQTGNMEVLLNFSNLQLNEPSNLRFEIPANYQAMEE